MRLALVKVLGASLVLTSCRAPMTGASEDRSGGVVEEEVTLPAALLTIFQAEDGSYWFGSHSHGAYHYDNGVVLRYTKKDGLADDQVHGIQADSSGRVYFDTPGGVSRWDGRAMTTLRPVEPPATAWRSEPEDLWFKGSWDANSVYRYDGRSLHQLRLPEFDLEATYGLKHENSSYSPYGVYSIYKDSEGRLWFGTLSAGVYIYDGAASMWITEKELTVLDDGRVPGVRSIIEDRDRHFWLSNTLHRYSLRQRSAVGGESVLAYEKLDGVGGMSFPYFMSSVSDDQEHDLWMVTYSEGVWRYDGDELHHYPLKEGGEDVLLFSIYKDRQGVLWLGTHNAGALRFDGARFRRFVPGA